MPVRTGIYPGTFDPVTLGHLDLIKRAAGVVDALVVAIAEGSAKTALFSVEARKELLAGDISDMKAKGELPEEASVTVASFSGLLVDFAAGQRATMIIRGLRAVSDYDYEMQMAGVNARLNPHVPTVFLAASECHQFVASRWAKEVARMGGDLSSMVSPRVATALRSALGEGRA
ncbi:MAG: pantetheine-phosphate adenylyltransferase [Rickettsiales bacterium]